MPEAQWRGDGFRLVEAIEAHHPDPFRAVSRDTLRRQAQRVDALDSRDPNLLAVELMRIVALLGPRNGHTAIHPLEGDPHTRRAYPLRLHEFDDGIFVVAAERTDLVGAEVEAIGGTGVGDVVETVTPLIAYDNASTIRARRPAFLVDAAVLRGLGVVEDTRPTAFRLRSTEGRATDVALDAVPVGDFWTGALGPDWLPMPWRTAYLRRGTEWHWVERTGDGRGVHVGYNVTLGDVGSFAGEVEALAADHDVRSVVLDLRLNGGGDNRTYRPLLDAIRRISTHMPISVLTSRVTFSAAMQLVVDLEQQTPAVFVGEPTGGSPNQFGDAIPIHLPQSQRTAQVATIAWMTAGDTDARLTREPDIHVAQESSPFFADDDPTLRAALEAVS